MGRAPISQRRIVGVLADGSVLSARQIGVATGLSKFALWEVLRRCWKNGLVLRSDKAIYEPERLNKGRAGRSRNVRPFHLYALRPAGVDRLESKGSVLVRFSESAKDPRGGNGKSKAGKIVEFLRTNKGTDYFSKEIAEALKDQGVRAGDVMGNLRRPKEFISPCTFSYQRNVARHWPGSYTRKALDQLTEFDSSTLQ